MLLQCVSALLVLAAASSAVAPDYAVLIPATVATTWVGPLFRAAGVPVLASLLLGIPANVTAVATLAERLTAAIQAGEACSWRAGFMSLAEWKLDVVKPDMFSGAAPDPSLGTLWMGVAGGVAWGAVTDGTTSTSVTSSNSYKLLGHVIGGKAGFYNKHHPHVPDDGSFISLRKGATEQRTRGRQHHSSTQWPCSHRTECSCRWNAISAPWCFVYCKARSQRASTWPRSGKQS